MKNAFCDRLAEQLKKRGLTQKELSIRAGVTEAAVSHYLKGDRMPRASVLARIAEVLGITTDYLVGGDAQDAESEVLYAQRLIARNVHQMSKEEKMRIINILMSDD